MTETIEQQNVLQTDRMKNSITTELQNDRMTEKQNDKTTELQNDRMTQRQNQGRRWTYRTYLSRSLEGKVTSSARATRHATLAAIRGGGADTKNKGRRTNLSLKGGGREQRQGHAT